MKKKYFFIAVLCLMPFAVNSAYATTVPYSNFDQLIEKSDHIVKGIVKDVRSKKHKETGNFYTVVKLKRASIIDDTGEKRTWRLVKLRYEGGVVDIIENGQKVGEEGMTLSGTPEFVVGEEVIIFVRKNGRAKMPITGWQQGIFKISKTGTISNYSGLPVVGLQGSDVMLKTENGIVSSNAASSPVGRAVLSSKLEKPELLYSEGGEDTLVSHRVATSFTQSAISEKKLNLLKRASPMSVSAFVAMIQKRKAHSSGASYRLSAKGSSDSAASTNDLFSLPILEVNGTAGSPAALSVTDAASQNIKNSYKGSSATNVGQDSYIEDFLPTSRPTNQKLNKD